MDHIYKPYGAARKLFECRDTEVVMSGSAGTGKSKGCLEKVVSCAFKYPGARFLMVRKTRESLTTSGLVTLQEHVIKAELEAGIITYYGGSKKDPANFRFPNGSLLMVGGMDKSNKVMSTEYDMIYVQEAIELEEDDWDKLTTRLRNGRMPYQQLIADTNPDSATHWLKVRCDQGKTTMIQSVHEDNPVLYNETTGEYTDRGLKYIAQLDKLSGVNYKRLRLGMWVSAEGIVYDDFSHDVHVIDDFPIPDDWPRYWVIDFGYTNPFCLQWWAEDGDGRLYLYREIYRSQMIVEDHCQVIKDIVAPDGEWIEPKPNAVITDHDAEDRKTFTRHMHIQTKAAKKDVTRGIEAVKQRLRKQGDGKPRIFFMRNALVYKDKALETRKVPTSTIGEISGYVWSPKKTDAGQDQPEKVNDHGMDSMRYMVAYRDLRPRQHVA